MWSSLKHVLNSLQNGFGEMTPKAIVSFYTFCTFADLAGSMGTESNEGSLYMTDSRFIVFSHGAKVLQEIVQEGVTIDQAFTRFLQVQVSELNLSLYGRLVALAGSEHIAIVRLVALAGVTDEAEAKVIMDEFFSMAPDERQVLTQHLTAGYPTIERRPGFVFADALAFLRNAWSNPKCGLLPALTILARVCDKAAKELANGQSVFELNLGRLAKLAKKFFGSVDFQDVPCDFSSRSHAETIYNVCPKSWIPVKDGAVLDTIKELGTTLAHDLLEKKVKGENFRERAREAYPELRYFTDATTTQRDQTYGALMSVFWLVSGNREAFIRSQ